MKKALPTREIEDMPQNFCALKREFQKIRNMFFARSKVVVKEAEYEFETDKKEVPMEAKALFWAMLQEFYSFLSAEEAILIEDLLKDMDEKKVTSVPLYQYGFKVDFDEEAKWFYKKELTNSEWAEYDRLCNKKLKESKSKDK